MNVGDGKGLRDVTGRPFLQNNFFLNFLYSGNIFNSYGWAKVLRKTNKCT